MRLAGQKGTKPMDFVQQMAASGAVVAAFIPSRHIGRKVRWKRQRSDADRNTADPDDDAARGSHVDHAFFANHRGAPFSPAGLGHAVHPLESGSVRTSPLPDDYCDAAYR